PPSRVPNQPMASALTDSAPYCLSWYAAWKVAMRPTRIDALPTSRKAPTPSASSSRATPPLTTERGDTMIQPSQCSAPKATRPRLRKRPPNRVTPAPTDHSPVRKVLPLAREPTSVVRTGKLITRMRLQDGGQGAERSALEHFPHAGGMTVDEKLVHVDARRRLTTVLCVLAVPACAIGPATEGQIGQRA